jgi:hypothetical protein
MACARLLLLPCSLLLSIIVLLLPPPPLTLLQCFHAMQLRKLPCNTDDVLTA